MADPTFVPPDPPTSPNGAGADRRSDRAPGRPLPGLRSRPDRPLRHPLIALPAMILFGLLAAFFAWQSAEPLWLSLGHGVLGTATVTRCDATNGAVAAGGPDPTYLCVSFEAGNGAFRVADVTLFGAGDAARSPGASVPARMVAADRAYAYLAEPAALHLRWSTGMLLVLACGGGIAWATGATRLHRARARRRAMLLSFTGPLLLAVGFLAGTV